MISENGMKIVHQGFLDQFKLKLFKFKKFRNLSTFESLSNNSEKWITLLKLIFIGMLCLVNINKYKHIEMHINCKKNSIYLYLFNTNKKKNTTKK